MASEKFIYVDTNGDYSEDSAAIQTSAGAADADKLVKTSSDGKLDSSLINFQTIKRYFVADAATTAALPAVTYANGTAGVGATLTAGANGALAAQDGITLAAGERLLVKDQAAALQNGIYEVTDVGSAGTPFILTRTADFDEFPEMEDGIGVAVGQGSTQADTLWLQTEIISTVGTDSVSFINVGTNAVDAGAGIIKTGNKLEADLLASGGIKFVGAGDAGELAVEPADFAGEGMIDDGADNLAIDWSTAFNDAKAIKAEDINSTANGEGASIVGIEDSAGYFTSTDVEGALAELAVTDLGEAYTVGAGGVTAGDMVYVSANNTVLPFSSLTTFAQHEAVIGFARTTESAAGSVVVMSATGKVLPGVLSGATAGDRYWWDGSALVTSPPSGAGSYAWKAGKAKNATDMVVFMEFVKKNK